MRLSKFIRENEEEILKEWERFARGLNSAPNEMNKLQLRDHAEGLLKALVADLESPRSNDTKSRRESSRHTSKASAAEIHGDDRMQWGFTIHDLLAEFQALRATIIRLWGTANDELEREDLVNFNASLDDALAESMRAYTHQKERQANLLETMLSYSSDQTCILDREGCIIYINSTMARAYGKHPKELYGRRVDELDAEFAAEAHRQIESVLSTGRESRGDFTTSTSEGEVHVIEYLFAPVVGKDRNIEAVGVNARDVTERKAWEQTLWKHANHDHLTGVPNRRLLMDRLDQDIRFARRSGSLLAVLYIDLDKFKEANDRLGHDGGDALLRQAAERIGSCIRETDTVARMGGDEFTVILTDVGDRKRVEAVARAILTRLSRPYPIQDEIAHVGGSVGVALYPEHGESVDDLLMSSDRAMYGAKQSGGDRVAFFAAEDPAPMRPRKAALGEHQRRH